MPIQSLVPIYHIFFINNGLSQLSVSLSLCNFITVIFSDSYFHAVSIGEKEPCCNLITKLSYKKVYIVFLISIITLVLEFEKQIYILVN